MSTYMKTLCAVVFSLFVSSASAVPLTNGDFSSGMGDWNDASSFGSATVVGGQAQLDTGAFTDLYSSVLVQGDDGFFNFFSPITLDADVQFLSFDVAFFDLGVDATETGGAFFSDALNIWLYDALDWSYDLGIDPLVDISFGSTMTTLLFDVSSLAGREVALSFELSDANDGRNSRVVIDNVEFIAEVPAPSVILLMATGLLLMGRRKYFVVK